MTRFELLAAAFVVFAVQLAPTRAQVSEPAAAAAQDPSFSIYSNYPRGGAGFEASHAMMQALPDDDLRPLARPHRAHRVTRRY